MDLFPVSFNCGDSNAPGTKTNLYLVPAAELTAWPGTRDVVNAGTENEDPMILDEPFTFVSTSGIGYWRTVRIIRDTGQILSSLEGEIGGRSWNNQILFTLPRIDSEQKQFARLLANGCLVGMLPDREGVHHVIGNNDDPAIIESIELDSGQASGDRRSIAFVLQHPDGAPHFTYDAETHGINTTPNV